MANTQKRKQIAPGLWQLQTDLYEIRVRALDPRTGKRIAKWRRFNGTRSEALRAREAWRVELEESDARASREKLGDYATSWLETKLARNDLAPSTAERYALALDLHILPALGEIYLDALTPRLIDHEVAAWAQDFESETVNGWLRVLRTVLAGAVRGGLIDTNAARAVPAVRPRLREEDAFKDDDEETNSLSLDELNAYLAAWRELYPDDFPLVALLALTGARWGEATALIWPDITRAAELGALRIRRSQFRGKVRPTTKTGKTRIVPFPEPLAVLIADHKRAFEARFPDGDVLWVFPNGAGKPRANGSLSERGRAVLAHAKITKRFTIHGLRRTATDLVRRTALDPVLAKAIIGHSTDRMREHYSTVAADEAAAVGPRLIALVPRILN